MEVVNCAVVGLTTVFVLAMLVSPWNNFGGCDSLSFIRCSGMIMSS